jgi:transposase
MLLPERYLLQVEVRIMVFKYRVALTDEERETIRGLLKKGTQKARVFTRARILLLSDEGKKDTEIAGVLRTAATVPHDIRKRYTEGGLDLALYDLPHPGSKRLLTGAEEAEVIATACTKAPKGHKRWTLTLLTRRIRRRLKKKVSESTIWRVLLRSETKPWLKKSGVFRN